MLRLGLTCFVVLFGGSTLAQTDARISFLTRQLKFAQDPRARAQTALILGASKDSRAVPALCEAMADVEPVVRIAVVNSLAELKLESAAICLRQHTQEANPEVVSAIERALKSMSMGAAKQALYVALELVNNGATLTPEELGQIEANLKERLVLQGAVFAPPNETQDDAKKALGDGRLKGYLLMTEIQPHGTAGLKVKLLCMTYPDKALRAQVSVKGSGPTAKLIPALVTRVLDDSASQCGWSE